MTHEHSVSSTPEKTIRHIIALSGGKDSSALAIYMRGKVENMEYALL